MSTKVIAGPLLKFFGTLGARLISLVLFFVFGMLLSGRGLIDFLKLLAAPFVFIGKCFNGLQNMFIGGEFVDAFDDDLDDDKAKRDFDADLEAISIANSRKSRQKPSERSAQNKKDVESLPDDYFIDIPLPTDHLIVHDGDDSIEDIEPTPEEVQNTKTERRKAPTIVESDIDTVPEDIIPDEGLEQLISKAADAKTDTPEEELTEEEEPAEEKKKKSFFDFFRRKKKKDKE